MQPAAGGCERPRCVPLRTAALVSGVNCLAYDEAIMAQQDRIQQEIAVQNPLVSERLELSVLYKEYAEDDNIYQQKIKDLHKKYSYIRKTRPDGNCFYRAFGFSHLEALLDDSKELQRFKAVSAKSKEDLVSQGFTEFTIEDFHNTFMDLIEQVEKQTSVADLLASFNDQSTSDYLVVYLRLLTSGYLQRESKFFEHFIEGGRTVKEFCQQEVEPMCKESDHIHIIALAQALSVSIQVEYMDRGEGGTTNPHIFPEGSEPKGMLVVSRVCACPCSAACPAAVCPAVPALPQVGSSWLSTCPHPSLPTRSSFEGAWPLGDPPW
ncbi:hypothetical protein GH733_007568 [Mirounga leonina]|nr:hypothetical protein GH733_007568 [Mirounga leonina]